jgi:hypothetical protein
VFAAAAPGDDLDRDMWVTPTPAMLDGEERFLGMPPKYYATGPYDDDSGRAVDVAPQPNVG